MYLTHQLYPEAKGVFCDTGLEFPEVKEHVKNTENIEIIRHSMSYKQVLDIVYPSKYTTQERAVSGQYISYRAKIKMGKMISMHKYLLRCTTNAVEY